MDILRYQAEDEHYTSTPFYTTHGCLISNQEQRQKGVKGTKRGNSGRTLTGPGRIGIPEMMRTDELGFSLCAVPLEIVGSCISKWHGQNCSRVNGGRVYSRPERGRGTQ